MNKTKTRIAHPFLILPVALVGADVDGKPNFEPIAWFNIVDYKPYKIGVSSEKSHNTNEGIRKNKTFSVNIPSAKMAAATDYCGLHSGKQIDKSKVFDVFYGELKNAPMIKQCPLNLECRLTQTAELVHNELFI